MLNSHPNQRNEPEGDKASGGDCILRQAKTQQQKRRNLKKASLLYKLCYECVHSYYSVYLVN
jgi:hypothetical protein|eukprot:COSAG06_NODE_1332_length_9842_cov_155.567074_2_plen_62_part_00